MLIRPFRALRPLLEFMPQVVCVPYDVISTNEARQLGHGKPHSFLHVIRPEIGLPASIDIHDDLVYERGATELERLESDGVMVREQVPSIYVYRLDVMGQAQTGVFTCVSVKEYDSNKILKHEMTRPDKEDDRTRHILTQRAHAEPVMLAHQPDMQIAGLIHRTTEVAPLYDITTDDGVRHTIWRSDEVDSWIEAFARLEQLYVADGHHRCKAASRAYEVMKEVGDKDAAEAAYFPAVLFSTDQMQIMAYNRVVHHASHENVEMLFNDYSVIESGVKVPDSKGKVCVYTHGEWKTIRLNAPKDRSDAVKSLDVTLLQEQVLERYFGIGDPRTDNNISFIGGIRGTDELEMLVDAGQANIAFSMYPTSIDELIEVSDQHRLMPPKSTWFEPKLRSGFLVHTF